MEGANQTTRTDAKLYICGVRQGQYTPGLVTAVHAIVSILRDIYFMFSTLGNCLVDRTTHLVQAPINGHE